MTNLPRCTQCGSAYPSVGAPFLCSCGGTFNYLEFPKFALLKNATKRSGIWKYRNMLSLPDDAPEINLGEGGTALVDACYESENVFFKLEYQNPTGSYKDRGSAVLVSFLISRGVNAVVEDSSGNAGASLAAYAARAGLRSRIFVPASASGPKREQIKHFGAELVAVPGPRSAAATAVRAAVSENWIYASHAFMPFGLTGIATIAYELFQELGNKTPGTVIAPVGHGGLLFGIINGFKALRMASVTSCEPFYVGVQAAGCAPIFTAYEKHEITLREPQESDTIAEGVKVSTPIHGSDLLHEVENQRGCFMQVTEEELIQSYNSLSKRGFFVEPTSALPWAAYEKGKGRFPEPVIMILTGAGYKTKSYKK